MKLHRQYLQLAERFAGTAHVETTLEELADIWGCTARNAALLIGRMRKRGWIDWRAGRGRGKRSGLAMLVTPEEIAGRIIASAETSRDLLHAVEQLGALAPAPNVQARLEAALLGRFGFRRETAGKRRIDVLRLPLRQAPRTLDPLAMNLLAESFIAGHVYDPLIRLEHGRPVPHVAHAWEASPDGGVWTFRLRKGVPFHHGKELDSRDAAFTLDRLRTAPPGTLYRPLFAKIRRVAVRDERSFRVELESPLAFLPELLATGRAALLPADLGGTDPARFRRRPVGTGPFKLTACTGRLIELEAFPAYFRERAHLDKVEIWILADDQAETFGGTDGGPFRVIHNPREAPLAEPEWRRIGSGVTVSKFLTVNTKKPGPLADPAARAALLDGLSAAAAGSGDALAAPAGAAREAAPPADRPLRLLTIQPYEKDAAAVAGRLRRMGVQVEAESVPPGAFTAERRLAADLLLFSLIRDREAFLRRYDLFLTMAERLDDRAASAVRVTLAAIDRTESRAERERLMADLERRLIRDRLLVIWQERSAQTAVHASVGGAETASQGWVDLRSIWFG